MTPKERRDHLERIGKLLAIAIGSLTLMGFVWRGMELWLLPRREHERVQDSTAVVSLLHAVRDSARQEKIWRAIKYEGCMRRTKNSYPACAVFHDDVQ